MELSELVEETSIEDVTSLRVSAMVDSLEKQIWKYLNLLHIELSEQIGGQNCLTNYASILVHLLLNFPVDFVRIQKFFGNPS